MHSDSATGRHPLLAHPAATAGAVRELSVAVTQPAPERLELGFLLSGNLELLKFPEPRAPVRADELWRHTCFEAFIGHGEANDYWEYNFSPSGAWAAYHFSAYREGMAPHLVGAPPLITRKLEDATFSLHVLLDLSWLAKSSAGAGLKLGLTAVVEDRERGLSYWALRHTAEKPDFHRAESFVVVLE
jgi:hypothetical protein